MTHPDITDEELGELVQRVREATGALMQADVRRYLALVNHAPDYLPDQNWPLRVTLVFRREDSDWRLVHRHADALVHPISMEQLSLLARGSVEPG